MTVPQRLLLDEAPARPTLPRAHVCDVVRVGHIVNSSLNTAPFTKQ
jgi:hypothetical protein